MVSGEVPFGKVFRLFIPTEVFTGDVIPVIIGLPLLIDRRVFVVFHLTVH